MNQRYDSTFSSMNDLNTIREIGGRHTDDYYALNRGYYQPSYFSLGFGRHFNPRAGMDPRREYQLNEEARRRMFYDMEATLTQGARYMAPAGGALLGGMIGRRFGGFYGGLLGAAAGGLMGEEAAGTTMAIRYRRLQRREALRREFSGTYGSNVLGLDDFTNVNTEGVLSQLEKQIADVTKNLKGTGLNNKQITEFAIGAKDAGILKTDDFKKFGEKLEELIKDNIAVAEIMGTTLERSTRMMSDLRQRGFTNAGARNFLTGTASAIIAGADQTGLSRSYLRNISAQGMNYGIQMGASAGESAKQFVATRTMFDLSLTGGKGGTIQGQGVVAAGGIESLSNQFAAGAMSLTNDPGLQAMILAGYSPERVDENGNTIAASFDFSRLRGQSELDIRRKMRAGGFGYADIERAKQAFADKSIGTVMNLVNNEDAQKEFARFFGIRKLHKDFGLGVVRRALGPNATFDTVQSVYNAIKSDRGSKTFTKTMNSAEGVETQRALTGLYLKDKGGFLKSLFGGAGESTFTEGERNATMELIGAAAKSSETFGALVDNNEVFSDKSLVGKDEYRSRMNILRDSLGSTYEGVKANPIGYSLASRLVAAKLSGQDLDPVMGSINRSIDMMSISDKEKKALRGDLKSMVDSGESGMKNMMAQMVKNVFQTGHRDDFKKIFKQKGFNKFFEDGELDLKELSAIGGMTMAAAGKGHRVETPMEEMTEMAKDFFKDSKGLRGAINKLNQYLEKFGITEALPQVGKKATTNQDEEQNSYWPGA